MALPHLPCQKERKKERSDVYNLSEFEDCKGLKGKLNYRQADFVHFVVWTRGKRLREKMRT